MVYFLKENNEHMKGNDDYFYKIKIASVDKSTEKCDALYGVQDFSSTVTRE